MATTAYLTREERQALVGLPPLLAGDHLDRTTFHERYEAMPEGIRAELIGGVVYMSPLYPPHGEAHSEVVTWLGNYKADTPGVRLLDNATVFLADDGEPQPDACLLLPASAGGRTRDEEQGLAGAPELVVEVAYSSESYDLFNKKDDYQRASVREYVVVVLREQQVVWFLHTGERFEGVEPDADGLFRSRTFPGLWLDPGALLRHDTGAVRQVLERGLASPEHAAFVRRLAR